MYTKLLTAPRSLPSTRLPGVPTTRGPEEVGLVEPPCGPTTFRSVKALELWGDNLGLIVRYVFEGLPGISRYTKPRSNRVSDRSAQQIAFLASGLNGQSFVGPSFFSGRLAWYRACAVTEASCNTFVGPWRYRISTRRYEQGAPGPVLVLGFADTGTRLYEVVGCPDVSVTAVPAPPPAPACAITSVAPPAYAPVAAPELASSQPPCGSATSATAGSHPVRSPDAALRGTGPALARASRRAGGGAAPAAGDGRGRRRCPDSIPGVLRG